eukprot:COSAG03_NODE_1187_length_4618_cov_6.759239_2_plen_73_part_00
MGTITVSESRSYRPPPPPEVAKFLARQYWDSLVFCSSRHLSRPPAAGRPRHEGIPYSSQFMILRIDSTEFMN